MLLALIAFFDLLCFFGRWSVGCLLTHDMGYVFLLSPLAG